MTFKDSVRTAKKTQHFTITKINRLTLFKEIRVVYFEDNTKHKNIKCSYLLLQQVVYFVTTGL
jgi:hypothetical protein